MNISDEIRAIVREELGAALQTLLEQLARSRSPETTSGSVPRVLTVAEAATYANAHDITIRRALIEGDLHGVQNHKGAHWRVRRECLDAWIDKAPCPHGDPQRLGRRR